MWLVEGLANDVDAGNRREFCGLKKIKETFDLLSEGKPLSMEMMEQGMHVYQLLFAALPESKGKRADKVEEVKRTIFQFVRKWICQIRGVEPLKVKKSLKRRIILLLDAVYLKGKWSEFDDGISRLLVYFKKNYKLSDEENTIVNEICFEAFADGLEKRESKSDGTGRKKGRKPEEDVNKNDQEFSGDLGKSKIKGEYNKSMDEAQRNNDKHRPKGESKRSPKQTKDEERFVKGGEQNHNAIFQKKKNGGIRANLNHKIKSRGRIKRVDDHSKNSQIKTKKG